MTSRVRGVLSSLSLGAPMLVNPVSSIPCSAKNWRVSSTPGRTRTINFIGIYSKPGQPEPELLLVDLPGYGYAKISRSISAEWPQFIEPYLQERSTLQLAIVLVDI